MIWKKTETEEAPSKELSLPPPPPPVAASRTQPQPPRDRALIGPSIEIKGNLTGGEDLYVEGRVEGKIELLQHSITIGKNGRVKADITGRTIVVMGEVNGNLFGEEQIVLHQSSKVLGNLSAPRVTLEDGAQFKGSIDMSARASSQPAPVPAREANSATAVEK